MGNEQLKAAHQMAYHLAEVIFWHLAYTYQGHVKDEDWLFTFDFEGSGLNDAYPSMTFTEQSMMRSIKDFAEHAANFTLEAHDEQL